MRTLLVYLLALAALATGVFFGFPELFGRDAAATAEETAATAAPPVIVVEVQRRPFADTLDALGTVHANESVDLTANRADHVTVIHFDDGQKVDKGQLLLEMKAEEEQALLQEARAIRDQRKLQRARVLELVESRAASQQELDNANATYTAAESRVIALEAAIADRRMRAPFSGVLGLRRVSVGAYVQPTTVITTLDDLSVVKLDFTIPGTWLPIVLPGMPIAARSDAWPDEAFAGKVTTIDTRLDERTRSARVRAILPNPELRLRPGMLLKVTVNRGEEPVLQVPEESLIPLGSRHFVLRVDAEQIARRVEVEVGRRGPGSVEILKGLAPGDRVIVEGIVRVRPDNRVEVVDTRRRDAANGAHR